MSDLREALKPCPFCGGEPDIRTRQDEDIWTHNTVTWTGVHCAECGIGFDWPPGAEPTAVEQWNTRAALAQPEAVGPEEVGWTGKKCPDCGGVGQVYCEATDNDGACPSCGGTGDEYDSSPKATTPPLAPDERMRRALEKIAAPDSCGCVPCTGQCRSQMSLSIIIDEMRDLASEALSRADEGKESLYELLAGMTDANRHPEIPVSPAGG